MITITNIDSLATMIQEWMDYLDFGLADFVSDFGLDEEQISDLYLEQIDKANRRGAMPDVIADALVSIYGLGETN